MRRLIEYFFMSPSDRAICVDPKQVDQVWPLVRSLLSEAARHGFSNFGLIEADVLSGGSLLWLVWNGESIQAAAVTELIERDGAKECCIALCAGSKMSEWIDAYADIERFARDEECRTIRIIGRKGWERALSGYRQACVVLEKEL